MDSGIIARPLELLMPYLYCDKFVDSFDVNDEGWKTTVEASETNRFMHRYYIVNISPDFDLSTLTNYKDLYNAYYKAAINGFKTIKYIYDHNHFIKIVSSSNQVFTHWYLSCFPNCIFCLGSNYNRPLIESYDVFYQFMQTKCHHYRSLVISRWENGLDAKGNPVECQLKPAKKFS